MHILAPVKRSLSKHIQTLVKCTAEQVASISTAQQEIPIPNAYTHSAAQVSSVPSIQGEEKQFMREAAEHFINYAVDSQSGDGKVVNLVNPNQMKNEFRQHGCAIELDDLQQPCDKDVLLSGIQQSLKFCVNTRHPLFFNQLYACSDVVSTVGDWLATVVNTNVHTFEVAPVFTVVEVEVLSKIARVIGGEYAQVHDGLFAPGGSIANLYGMHIARNRVDPDFKTRGASGGPNVVALTSAHSHYSYKKSAILTGVGLDNLIAVKCDERGAMIPEELDAAIEKSKANGQTPFFVGATAGTTVLGACDPFIEIADVCKKHGLWLHVDGCWGGSAIISPKYKHLVDGMNRADSISWNFHKWLGQPTQCSAFVSKHANILKQVNALNADYLFQPDKLNTEYDLGDKTIQCGRKADAYKLWLSWKALGDQGFAEKVEHAFHLAEHIENRVRNSDGKFVLVTEPTCTNVCFWYVPPSLRPFDSSQTEKYEAISKAAPYLKERMQQSGDAMIGYQPLDGLPNFFRIVFASSFNVTTDDLDAMLARMDQYGQSL
eukprot:TRINITY_DN4049_c0_g1_i1.p1 TRINITY_DN4049_c0_g1~~TRINITY_DN4049_c0_g1_i1.p1  ORF type:complete len:555 (+),score=43.99 TRINITY_DN4049_c0_g1_i1:29-1666(+)